jgi:hypothetical protein
MNIQMEINAVNVDLRPRHRLDLHPPVPVFAIPIILKIRITPTKYAHCARQIPTSMHLSIQKKEELWMFANAARTTFGTT